MGASDGVGVHVDVGDVDEDPVVPDAMRVWTMVRPNWAQSDQPGRLDCQPSWSRPRADGESAVAVVVAADDDADCP